MYDGRGKVGFRKRGLIPFAFGAFLAVALGVALLIVDLTAVGPVLPRFVTAVLAAATLTLGGWLAYGAAERALSDDPAVGLRDDLLYLHVNPGRKVVLRRDQVAGIDGPSPSVHRAIAGPRQLMVRTELQSAVFSRDVVVVERFLDAPIVDVADVLRHWHQDSGTREG